MHNKKCCVDLDSKQLHTLSYKHYNERVFLIYDKRSYVYVEFKQV